MVAIFLNWFLKIDSTEDHWELLDVKEIANKGDLTLVFEDDVWSKINYFRLHLFAEAAEKNSDKSKPTKRDIQPLWLERKRIKNK